MDSRTHFLLAGCLLLASGCENKTGRGPVLSHLEPDAGYNGSDTAVVIFGERFFLDYRTDLDKDAQPRVDGDFLGRIGSRQLEDLTWVNDHTLEAVVPAGLDTGTYDVTITTPAGDTGTLDAGFTVTDLPPPPPMAISSIEPAIGVNDGATSATVSGISFDASAMVSLGTTPVSVTSATSNSIQVSIPAGLSAGLYDTRVATNDGDSAVLPDSFTVVDPADLQSTLQVVPDPVVLGDPVTLRLSVENTGGSDALAVTPTAPTWVGTADLALLSGPTPAAQDIPDATQVVFEWQYSATRRGTATLTAGATGSNQHSGRPVSTANTDSNLLTVDPPETLAATVTAAPTTASVGQEITVTMTVTNNGSNAATSVWPVGLSPSHPDLVLVSGAPSTRADIAPAAQADFAWTFVALEAGTVAFSGTAEGLDSGTSYPVTSNLGMSNAIQIRMPAELEITSFLVSPAIASAGQDVILSFVVHNAGAVDSSNVTVLPATAVGGSVEPASDLSPLTASIAAGDQVSFQRSYTTTSTGSLSFRATAQGNDSLSGLVVTSAAADSNTIGVVQPAQPSVQLSAIPSTLTEGQDVTVTMEVSNMGAVAAETVTPSSLTLSGSGGASYFSGPNPTSLASLAPSDAGSFTWVFHTGAGDAGTLSFTGSAAATDALSSLGVSSPPRSSPTLLVQTPPELALTVLAPPTVSRSQTGVIVRVRVDNIGQAPALIANADDARLLMIPSPPVGNFTIARTDTVSLVPGGESRTLTFTVDVAADASLATYDIDAEVVAEDVNNGDDASTYAGATSTTTDTWQVLDTGTPANLHISLEITSPTGALDGVVSTQQSFSVTATVDDDGSCGVDNSGEIELVLGGTGATTTESLTRALAVGVPAVFNLAASSTAVAASSLQVSISNPPLDLCSSTAASVGTGSDSVSMTTVTGADLALSAVITGPPGATDGVVSTGQQLTVEVAVANTGTAATTGVAEVTVDPRTTGVSLVSPASLTQSFVAGTPIAFVFSAPAVATLADTLRATLSAVPLDENSAESAVVSTASADVSLATVAAASLTITVLDASPDPVVAGDPVAVDMTIQNDGVADATVTPPALLSLGGDVAVTRNIGPTPASTTVPGGSAQTFSWTYDVPGGASGTVSFSSRAGESSATAGVDLNSGDTVEAPTAASATITVVNIRRWYQDRDGDGFGNNAVFLDQIDPPDGYVLDNTDCDDGLADCNVDCVSNTDGDVPAVIDCVEVACGSDPNLAGSSCTIADGTTLTLADALALANDSPVHDYLLLSYSTAYDGTLTIDSGENACIDLRGRHGVVVTFSGGNEGFRFKDNDCVIANLTVNGNKDTIRFEGDNNEVRDCSIGGFEKTGVRIEGANTSVIGNTIHGGWGDSGDDRAGVFVKGVDGVVIADNVIVDNTVDGIQLRDATVSTIIDHNTISNCQDAVEIHHGAGTSDLCMRNNVLNGNSGLALHARETTLFDTSSACVAPLAAGPVYGNLDYDNLGGACGGADCLACACLPAGTFFEFSVDPMFDTAYCLGRPSLLDSAADLGYDLNGAMTGNFEAAAPEIGAQEDGAGSCQ